MVREIENEEAESGKAFGKARGGMRGYSIRPYSMETVIPSRVLVSVPTGILVFPSITSGLTSTACADPATGAEPRDFIPFAV